MPEEMTEELTFHFEGALAEEHELNFYEAARFQYAAARLIVKLMQFREAGRFAQKVTTLGNRSVLLQPNRAGSFDISIFVPLAMALKDAFINVPVSHLLSYVFDRIVGKASDNDVAQALNSNIEIVKQLGRIDSSNAELMTAAFNIIQQDQQIKEAMRQEQRDIYERRIAELTREKEMAVSQSALSRIDPAREQKLISMSAPLVSEMSTVLRQSANMMSVITDIDSNPKNILFLDRKMAQEIELSVVDKEITTVFGDIIQYNKETGWGKARMENSQTPISFSVPSDIKSSLQSLLLSAMGRDKVHLQTYIVRSKSAEPVRLIVVSILPPPPA